MKMDWIVFKLPANEIEGVSIYNISPESSVTMPKGRVGGVTIVSLIMESLESFFSSFFWNWGKLRWFVPLRDTESEDGVFIWWKGSHGKEKRGRSRSFRHGGAKGEVP
jgi:hypothetical protein